MDPTSLYISIAALAYIGVTIYLANLDQIHGRQSAALRWMLYGVVVVVLLQGLTVLMMAIAGPATPLDDGSALADVNLPAAVASFALALVVAVVSGALIVSPASRLAVRRVVGPSASFDPESSVHLTAVVLALALIAFMAVQFVLGGGIEGMAQMLEMSGGVSFGEAAFNGVVWIVVALLGVGYAVRRTLPQTLARLGLRAPTRDDWRYGIAAGIGLYVVQMLFVMVWVLLVTPETLEEQTAATNQISQSIDNLPLALAVAGFAALGEEVLFRGAVQPVFGLVATSVLFALIHLQYALTPATLLIIVVALVLGWLRLRFSTSAAIIAHFVYNFILLALALTAGAQGL